MTINKTAILLPMLAAASAVAGCVPPVTGASAGRDTSTPITAGPVAGRCYPGGCQWFDIRTFEMVRETERAALIKISTREGESTHAMSADHPRSSRGVLIEWGPYHDVYVFCSRELPALLSQTENGSYEVQRLDLIRGYVPEELIATRYGHVCHPDGGMQDYGAAERLGYRALRDGERGSFTLRSPEAIFDRLAG